MIEKYIADVTSNAIKELYGAKISSDIVQIQNTKKEFQGDITVVVFPFIKISKKSPEQTGNDIGKFIISKIQNIKNYNVVKGFLNLVIDNSYWIDWFYNNVNIKDIGFKKEIKDLKPIVIEYSSPNTNKPLHLGHIRNNLLGYSISEILKANGRKVVKVNLVNDRGIHICKSMLAWKKWSNGETPESSRLKGDFFVGKYYVLFEKHYQEEVKSLISEGLSEDEAKKQAPLIIEAQNILKKWEAKDEKIVSLWKKMNNWVYKGFEETYKKLGIDFDKIYYESDTYLLGKSMVAQGLKNEVFIKKKDGSVWADLTDHGLKSKLLIRKDGTSVYITQDLGTAQLRNNDFNPEKLLYVVGNEQNYHFNILKLILKKINKKWADNIYHLSYGMVNLPEGKMKSREGNVVDADDLIKEMIDIARKTTEQLGKIENFTKKQAEKLYNIIGIGALKYFILKVDPKKNMLFNPEESIDFDGNTAPFIQYTYARIQSVLRKANYDYNVLTPLKNELLLPKEKQLIKLIYEFLDIISMAAETYSPAIIANYVYELAKQYNQFYHDITILKEKNNDISAFRIMLSKFTGNVIKSCMKLMGIDVPDKM